MFSEIVVAMYHYMANLTGFRPLDEFNSGELNLTGESANLNEDYSRKTEFF